MLPGCHRCNAAEVAIRNFKAHFLSILAGVFNNFPPNLWDWLLPQTKITINLIWQSNATPNVLAYTHLSGLFDYKKNPLTPMGCGAQVHEKSNIWDMGNMGISFGQQMVSLCITRTLSHIIVISSTPQANNYPTRSNFNTNILPIPPSHMPTK